MMQTGAETQIMVCLFESYGTPPGLLLSYLLFGPLPKLSEMAGLSHI